MKTLMYLAMLIASAVLHFVNGNAETLQNEEHIEWTECKKPNEILQCKLTEMRKELRCS